MKRILFVDDEPNVIAGLRRMLRRQRNEWKMEFSTCAAEALQRMDRTSFDVIVSDMRMPVMDGVRLLTEVMNRHPNTVRIMLSGYSDQEAVLRAVGPVHQFLSKPCDPDLLRNTVIRACALRARLADESLKKLISQTKSLPSLPAVYVQLMEELKSPDASLRRAGELISQDVAMTAKLLQLVNSSFFGLPQHIDSPTHAASLLGLQNLKPLVITAGVFSQLHAVKMSGYSLDRLTRHSLIVSACARKIAMGENRADERLAEDALLAGLMHDVGQIVMAAKLPQQYQKAMELAKKEKMPILDAERQSLGVTHCDVGAYLLDLWGLPNQIVESVAFHHDPTKCPERTFTALTAVHVADALDDENNQDDGVTFNADLNHGYLETLRLTHKVREWQTVAEAVKHQGGRR